MTDRIRKLLDATFDKVQAKFRRDVDWHPLLDGFVRNAVDDSTRARMGLVAMLEAEQPAFLEGETIAFLRTVKQIPDLHSDAEMDARKAAGTAFGEKGVVFNLTADFGPTIRDGLDKRLEEIESRLAETKDQSSLNFLTNAALSVKAVLGLVDRYRADLERGLPAPRPGAARGTEPFPTYADHRIAMSIAVAATRASAPVSLDNTVCAAKSFPTFFEDFEGLRRA